MQPYRQPRIIPILWLIAITVSSMAFLWALFHNFMDMGITLGIVDLVLSLACWRIATRRARRRRAWAAYLRRYQ